MTSTASRSRPSTRSEDRFRNVRVPVKAGYREVGATFLARSHAESDHQARRRSSLAKGSPTSRRCSASRWSGPYEPTGISEPTQTRERIFICYPETEQDELPCAERILTRLAHVAFRRPVSDADMDPVLDVLTARGAKRPDSRRVFRAGCSRSCRARSFCIEAKPDGPPAEFAPGEAYAVSDLELASRLAFFLWSAGPDEELLEAGGRARSSANPTVYEQQIERLFADPRSKALVTNFAVPVAERPWPRRGRARSSPVPDIRQ